MKCDMNNLPTVRAFTDTLNARLKGLEVDAIIDGLRLEYEQRGFWVFYNGRLSFFAGDADFERWLLKVEHELSGLAGVAHG